jgi:Flp pilus assembly protein TadG
MNLNKRTSSRRPSSEDGQALVITVFLMATIMVIAALVIDGGLTIVEKRHLQTAADAATLAAAQDISSGLSPATAEATACTYLNRNGYSDACTFDDATCPTGSKVNCVNIPPLSGPHSGDSQYVEVIAKHQAATPFLTAMTSLLLSSSARSVAAMGHGNPPPYNFWALNNTNCDATHNGENHTLLVKLGGQLTVTGDIFVNSCNYACAQSTPGEECNSNPPGFGDAFDIFGTGGNITAHDIGVNGGWETHDNDTVTCIVTTPCPQIRQPLPPNALNPFPGLVPPALGAAACPGVIYTAGHYPNPVPKLVAPGIAANAPSPVTFTVTGTTNPILAGDVVKIDNEQLSVTGVVGQIVTATRAQFGTTAAKHDGGKEVQHMIPSGVGTASSPRACGVASGTVTLQPGTYYGGICIGVLSGNACNPTCNNGTAHVTLAPGTYIMAGGGFWVCGSSTLNAPNVMIYNTNDPSHNADVGVIDQVLFDTTGDITLGPQTTGAYSGLSIYQDGNLTVKEDKCDKKSKDSTQWDIALVKIGNGINGLSGTIYAPQQHAMFGDSVSGTANLAVLTGCIYIDGADSTFDFQPAGLFGIGVQLAE